MSDKETTKYLEEVQERFEELVACEDWQGLNELTVELSDNGFHQEEKTLTSSMSEEDLLEYRHWQSKESEEFNNQD